MQLLGGSSKSSPSLLQDEVEFGYVQAPHKTFPVVFDSPRDRGLKGFPVKRILVPDLFLLPSPARPKALQTHQKTEDDLGVLHFGC